jgi:hypothetical protein
MPRARRPYPVQPTQVSVFAGLLKRIETDDLQFVVRRLEALGVRTTYAALYKHLHGGSVPPAHVCWGLAKLAGAPLEDVIADFYGLPRGAQIAKTSATGPTSPVISSLESDERASGESGTMSSSQLDVADAAAVVVRKLLKSDRQQIDFIQDLPTIIDGWQRRRRRVRREGGGHKPAAGGG